MNPYFCILNMPAAPAREIAVLDAANDAAAKDASEALAWRWPGFETIEIYEGERLVAVVSNPSLGFAQEPLTLPEVA